MTDQLHLLGTNNVMPRALRNGGEPPRLGTDLSAPTLDAADTCA
jgi:hypothetical protein